MKTIEKAIEMMMSRLIEEEGEGFKLEDGDEVSAVFNDGLIVISLENNEMNIKVIAEKPMEFDFSLDLVETVTTEID